jgi:flagellar hook-associated protein 1
MSINFSAFEIGRRALNASSLGLNISGQNIANVNTPGYSRQTIQQSAAFESSSSLGLIGNGVTVDGVRSFRDRFLDARLQSESGITGRLTAQRDALAPVDAAFSDATGGGGLQTALQNFFGSFRDLETQPNSAPLRTLVTGQGAALANAFQSTRARLGQIQQATDGSVRSTVDDINALAQQVASLNARIPGAEATGGEASALRDQRSEILRQLSDLGGLNSIEKADGTVDLTLGDGRALVLGTHVATLAAVDTPGTGLASITIDGQPAVIGNGRLRGLTDAVGTIGAQITALDQLAASVVTRVNTLHTSGTDQDGTTGVNFFSDPVSGQPVTAANITVSAAVAGNPRLVVASPLTQPAGSGTVAGAIANLLTDPTSQAGARTGSFSSLFGAMVSDAGQGMRAADDQLATQSAILSQVTSQRDSLAGVSLDEEAVNMLRYQRAYEAAARFLKIADEVTQTVIMLGQ